MAKGRERGVPNYKNELLIRIVSEMLPNGEYAWQAVAAAYHVESGEALVRNSDDLKKHWVKNLCNGMKKPTGKSGTNDDRIFRCIAIERKILKKTNSGMLGALSAEEGGDANSHSMTSAEGSDGDDELLEQEYRRLPTPTNDRFVDRVPLVDGFPLEQPCAAFEEEMTPAAVGRQEETPLVLPTQPAARRGSTASTARRSSTSSKRRKEPSEKTKNSTNKHKDRTSIASSIVKLVESINDGRTGGDNEGRLMTHNMNMMMMQQMNMMSAWMERQERRERKEERRQ